MSETPDNSQLTNCFNLIAQNKPGMNVLHLAAILDDGLFMKKLLSEGADPLLKDAKGRTPLQLSVQMSSPEATRTLIDHSIGENSPMLKFSDFTLYKPKGDGITFGGFYHDHADQSWLVKHGHFAQPKSVVIEYIAGGLYESILGDNASHTEIVIDNIEAQFLVGSKLLPGFQSLSDTKEWSGFTLTINNKPIKGFMDVISSTIFIGDTDAHHGNVGLIDRGDYYSFAKVDHSFVFWFDQYETLSLDNFRYELYYQYNITDIESLGFDAVYQSIASIGYRPFEDFSSIVQDKMSHVHDHMQVLQYNNLDQGYYEFNADNLADNLEWYESKFISGLQKQHQDYRDIADYMRLEKAIKDHDFDQVTDLLVSGLTLDHPFSPFFDAQPVSEYSYFNEVTGQILAEKIWPELDDLLNPKPKPIIGEVLTADTLFNDPNNLTSIVDTMRVELDAVELLIMQHDILPLAFELEKHAFMF